MIIFFLQTQEQNSPALVQAVRKDLAMAIRDLMEHGLMEVNTSNYQAGNLLAVGHLHDFNHAVKLNCSYNLYVKFESD